MKNKKIYLTALDDTYKYKILDVTKIGYYQASKFVTEANWCAQPIRLKYEEDLPYKYIEVDAKEFSKSLRLQYWKDLNDMYTELFLIDLN